MALTTVKQGGIATDAVGTAALDQDAGFTLAGLNGSSTVASEGGAVNTSIQQGLAKAWCSWSMNNTSNPYDSFNISSITDNSATQNTMTYSDAFNTANGQCVTTATNANSSGLTNYSSSDLIIHSPATTSVKIQSQSNSNPAFNGMQVTGDLA